MSPSVHSRPSAAEMRALLANAWLTRPYSLAVAVMLIPVGLLAVIVGAEVSRALSDITAPYVSRAMGAVMFAGGVLTVTGYLRRGATIEALGLALCALGLSIYGVGVLLGLGLGGMVAGPLALAVTVATVRRVQILLRLACDAAP